MPGKWMIEKVRGGWIKMRRKVYTLPPSYHTKMLEIFIARDDRPESFQRIPQICGKKSNARKWARHWIKQTPEATNDEEFRFIKRRCHWMLERQWHEVPNSVAKEDELLDAYRTAPIVFNSAFRGEDEATVKAKIAYRNEVMAD